MDEIDLTPDEALLLRRAQRLCQRIGASGTAQGLRCLADDYDAPSLCEGCETPATCLDDDGLGLCEEHARP